MGIPVGFPFSDRHVAFGQFGPVGDPLVFFKTMKNISVFLSLGLIFLAGVPALAAAEQAPTVRVAIVRDAADVTLKIDGAFDIYEMPGGKKLHHGRNLGACKVLASGKGIVMKPMVFGGAAVLRISARRRAGIWINRRPYRGEVIIIRTPAGKLTVVNVLDIEWYVKGVLVREISHKWPIDAIKAQAVATRTYALYQKECSKTREYDLLADTSSQVYGGFSSEKTRTNRAANFTYGEALFYQGRLFPSYFHATCGGSSERSSELWKIDIEPLAGGRLCSFCAESPHYRWSGTFDFKTIRKKLGAAYTLAKPLTSIRVVERNSSGRIRSLELKDEMSGTQVISAKEFRQLIGPDLVRSTNFIIAVDEGKVTFSGKGWGHGVGLCQWGALGMSKKGYEYEEILGFYYPLSVIKKAY